ncbi:MAG: 16S rRNA (guanine(527)-N(7))-methyltransferase RsmG [Treponema sp.]|nr:16S rRNA (guanine(527)-N(7))-methyltransferase RsmG [Treponema sp.]
MIQKLNDGLKKLSLDLKESQIAQLEGYIDAVLEFNKSYNLMKADSDDELAVNHILDSLAAVPHIKKIAGESLVQIGDIGSGGGCPGIPLSIAFPQFKFTLVERMEKRCVFLENVIKKLALKNVSVMCVQADSVPPESFDIAVFRAFHPFDKKIIKLLLKLIKKNGTLAAYKARSEKISAEMDSIKMIVKDYEKIPLTVPFLEDHERNLVVIRK